jgi:hypothetical protein
MGAVAALALAPAGALAAVQPDAVLTVRYTDAVTLLPVAEASVHVTARQGDAVIGQFDATTDADGAVVLPGVPLETGEGPAVVLDVEANKEATFVDDESGCAFIDTWHAERLAVAVAGQAVEVDFAPDEQLADSSIDCPAAETEPTGEVGGIVGAPKATLPSTDALGPVAAPAAEAGGLVIAAGLIAASAGLLLLTPRRRRAGLRVNADRRRLYAARRNSR